MGGRCSYRYYFKGCCLQDLFSIARGILVQLPPSFFSILLVSVHVVYPYSSIDAIATRKKLHFILSDWLDFHMPDSQSIAVQVLLTFHFGQIEVVSWGWKCNHEPGLWVEILFLRNTGVLVFEIWNIKVVHEPREVGMFWRHAWQTGILHGRLCFGFLWFLADPYIKKKLMNFLGSVWFVRFYGISTFVGYLKPNPFLCK